MQNMSAGTGTVRRATTADPLALVDPEAAELIEKERSRDACSLNLMAAESYPTFAVREALGTPIIGLEGYPGKRYHSGSFVLDEIELLCRRRALEAFHLDAERWGVNVQPLSGSLANLYMYVALLIPGDAILRMELSHGGHISHGHRSPSRKISEVSHRFESVAYHTTSDTGLIDYDEVERLALQHRPRLITTGYSAYCRLTDFERLRSIADRVGAYLHCDMAHICGFIAAELIPSPFRYCDVVTTTTYKIIRGPPGAMIFSKQALCERIDRTLFPRFQAGVSFANVLAIAVALKQLQSQESREEQYRFLETAKILAQGLQERGYQLVNGGTDLHMVLIDLRDQNISGLETEKVLEMANIVCNRNSIPGDSNGSCSGLRLATPQMTIRGISPAQGIDMAEFVHQGILLTRKARQYQRAHFSHERSGKPETPDDFLQYIYGMPVYQDILRLAFNVAEWVKQYPPPL